MKSQLKEMIVCSALIGAMALGACATEGVDHNSGRFVLRKQLQAHGEFRSQNMAREYEEYYLQLRERQARGEFPPEMNVNEYYEYLKHQEGKSPQGLQGKEKASYEEMLKAPGHFSKSSQ